LHPDGTPDTSFRPDPEWVAQFGVSKILVQPDGRILLNGLRLLSNGSYDASFEPGPLSGEPLLVQSDGRILMSESHCCPNQTILLRLLPSGAEDQSFPRILANGPISSLVPQPDGKTLVAGQFTEIDGARRPGLARLNTEPRLQFEGVRRDSAGNVKLTLGVQAGSRVVLEASDDLANWVALRTNAATSLTLELEDTDAANYSQHFYRARLAP
jgi:hypothetical protein